MIQRREGGSDTWTSVASILALRYGLQIRIDNRINAGAGICAKLANFSSMMTPQ